MNKDSKKYLALGGTILTTILLGMYTQSVSWVPELRAMAHFCGAVAVPGFTSFFASNLLDGYEKRKNKKLNKIRNNEKSLEREEEQQQNDKYQVNSKVKDILLKTSMVLGSVGYMAFCTSWESWQYAQTNIFQLPQYIADMAGPIVGMLTIGTVDCKPLYEKIDNLSDKIFKRKKEKTNEKQMDMANENEQNLNKEENVLSEQKYNKEELDKENLPSWDLRLYSQNREDIEKIKAYKPMLKNIEDKEKEEEYLER